MEKRNWISPEIQSLDVLKTENHLFGQGSDYVQPGAPPGTFGSTGGYVWDEAQKKWIPA